MKILIVGYGVVGKNMYKFLKSRQEFVDMQVDTYDIDPNTGATFHSLSTLEGYLAFVDTQGINHLIHHYDYCFICVDTPLKEDKTLDTSQVKNVVNTFNAIVDTFILKSTVPVGYTSILSEDCDIAFSPEYFGATVHANLNEQDFEIIGCDDKTVSKRVAQLYQKLYVGNTKFFYSTTREAELTKFMENSFLATKVTFVNDFYRLAKQMDIDYNVVREMFVADSRVNPSHTYVYPDSPYYDSHCLNKDLPAIGQYAKDCNIPLLIHSVEWLNKIRKDN